MSVPKAGGREGSGTVVSARKEARIRLGATALEGDQQARALARTRQLALEAVADRAQSAGSGRAEPAGLSFRVGPAPYDPVRELSGHHLWALEGFGDEYALTSMRDVLALLIEAVNELAASTGRTPESILGRLADNAYTD